MLKLPERNRIYQNHHFDSTRWDYFEPQSTDIIVATSYKAGTTWTQAIVAHLLFQDGNFPAPPSRDVALARYAYHATRSYLESTQSPESSALYQNTLAFGRNDLPSAL